MRLWQVEPTFSMRQKYFTYLEKSSKIQCLIFIPNTMLNLLKSRFPLKIVPLLNRSLYFRTEMIKELQKKIFLLEVIFRK